jgi:hypothetical protein
MQENGDHQGLWATQLTISVPKAKFFRNAANLPHFAYRQLALCEACENPAQQPADQKDN